MTNLKFEPANGRTFKIVHTKNCKLPFQLMIVSQDGSERICTRHKTEALARTNAVRYNPNIAVSN